MVLRNYLFNRTQLHLSPFITSFDSWEILLIVAESGDSGGISKSEALGARVFEDPGLSNARKMSAALISAKFANIRLIELFVVRLAESKPLGKRPLAAEISFSLFIPLKNKKDCRQTP
ncbi:hypothetical protein H9659_07560 [Sporosarcina sp. Sa3CUA8]|uniref:Uncharacterized protein n=1 Tax=Sporosarcina gallistercoris TaxID=2762245 RepID=A0ABR8PJ47_9BACL|nr:hypothetical protein [Sporosarcina gallistercoris]